MPRDQHKHKSKRLSLSRSNKLQSRSRRGPASIGVMRDPKQQTLTQFFKKPEQQRQSKGVETPSLCSVEIENISIVANKPQLKTVSTVTMASDVTEKLEQLSRSSMEQQTRISIDEVEDRIIHNVDMGKKEEMIEEEGREVMAVQEKMIEEEEREVYVMAVQEEEEDMDMIKENTVDADSLLKDLSSSDIDQLLSACDDVGDEDMHVGVASGSGDTRKSVVRLRVLQCEQQQSGLSSTRMLKVCDEEEEKQKDYCINLLGDWADSEGTDIRPGDVIQLVGDVPIPLPHNYKVNNNIYVIVNPDRLVSGTTVSTGIECERRAVLGELLRGVSQANESMFLGVLLHQVFDEALVLCQSGQSVTTKVIKSFVDTLLSSYNSREQLYALGLKEDDVKEKLVNMAGKIVCWCQNHLPTVSGSRSRQGFKLPRSSGEASSDVSVTEVRDIEENVWCPRYGLKGKVDATVLVKRRGYSDGDGGSIVPLELKTGRMMNQMGSLEHRAQVLLYCLMLRDKHQTDVPGGLLYYMKAEHTQGVPASHDEIRALVQLRNGLARYHGNYWDHVTLPSMSRNRHMCQRCSLRKQCTLYHRAIECGDATSSGLSEQEYMSGHEHLSDDHLEFFKKWFCLAVEELAHSQHNNDYKDYIWRRSHNQRERDGHCVSNLLPRQRVCDIQEFVQVDNRSLPESAIAVHSYVVVSKQDGTGWAVTTGRVHSITETSLYLKLNSPVPVDGVTLYTVDCVGYTRSDPGLHNLMELCLSDSERDQRLRELLIDLEHPRFSTPVFTSSEHADLIGNLNISQQEAIDKVLSSRDYTLLMGMPGTGKTTTIACLVQVLVRHGHSVLLTSHTNVAVDNILLKLKKVNVDFLRVGSTGRVHHEILHHTDEHVAAGVSSVAELRELYDKKPVVATTCHSINHPLFTRRCFDYCICDEATQISLPLSIGTIRCASNFVLVGDSKQLSPLTLSSIAREGGYAESVFDRLSSHHPEAVVSLTHQYRMNSDVMLLANTLIYDHTLVCGSEQVRTGQLRLADWCSCKLKPDWLMRSISPAQSVVFLNTDTYGKDLQIDSQSNEFEARVVHNLVATFLKFGVDPADILVITPYRQQLNLINRILSHDSMSGNITDLHVGKPNFPLDACAASCTAGSGSGVEVLTVDKCQGRDSGCVIISLVRSNTTGHVGTLLQDWKRINVALTRARHKIILIGSPSTLGRIPVLSSLLDLIRENNWMIDIDSVSN